MEITFFQYILQLKIILRVNNTFTKQYKSKLQEIPSNLQTGFKTKYTCLSMIPQTIQVLPYSSIALISATISKTYLIYLQLHIGVKVFNVGIVELALIPCNLHRHSRISMILSLSIPNMTTKIMSMMKRSMSDFMIYSLQQYPIQSHCFYLHNYEVFFILICLILKILS